MTGEKKKGAFKGQGQLPANFKLLVSFIFSKIFSRFFQAYKFGL